jgi:deoxycytidylate deaminase
MTNTDIWTELEDFANKASGDRKTHVASYVIWPNGQKVFGTNHLKDNHGLTEQEITERIRPQFYDAMKCSEMDAIERAEQLGLDFTDANLYSLLFPCPRCAEKIAQTKIKNIVARKHRVKHNGKFDNPLEDSQNIFERANITYDAGEPDGK